MFQDYGDEVVGFKSIPTRDRSSTDNSSQTSNLSVNSQQSQCVTNSDVCTQTNTDKMDLRMGEYDENKLSEFLGKVFPSVMKELDKIHGSSRQIEGTGEDVTISVVDNIQPPNQQLNTCSTAWSCTGGTIAVSYGQFKHQGQCIHDGLVHLYVGRNLSMTFDRKFQTKSCVTAFAWHPEQPSILAAGLYTGDIIIWNIQKEEDAVLTSTKKCEVGHCDKVTSICWIRDVTRDNTRMLLLTTGLDGRILLWRVSLTSSKITLLDLFLVSINSPFNKQSIKEDIFKTGTGLPVTCLSSTQHGVSHYIIGVTNNLLEISIRSTQNIINGAQYKEPVIFEYDKHENIISQITCKTDGVSFISSSFDGQIRIYNYMKAEPVQVLSTGLEVLGAGISQHIPDTIIYWEGQSVYFYNTRNKKTVQQINKNKQLITNVAVNQQRRDMLAVGDVSGNVEMWSITDENE